VSPLGTSATSRPNVPATGDGDVDDANDDDDEYGTFHRMRIGRLNRSTRRKSTPVPLRP
jgi:hypothetical protein